MKVRTQDGYEYEAQPDYLGWTAVVYDEDGRVIGSLTADSCHEIHARVNAFLERHEGRGED